MCRKDGHDRIQLYALPAAAAGENPDTAGSKYIVAETEILRSEDWHEHQSGCPVL